MRYSNNRISAALRAARCPDRAAMVAKGRCPEPVSRRARACLAAASFGDQAHLGQGLLEIPRGCLNEFPGVVVSVNDVQWVMGHAHRSTTQRYLNALTQDLIEGLLATPVGGKHGPAAPPAGPYDAESLRVLFGKDAG